MKNPIEPQTIDFAHLDQTWDFFPFSCSSGYYFLWNSQLHAPKIGPEKDAREYVKEAIRSYRRS